MRVAADTTPIGYELFKIGRLDLLRLAYDTLLSSEPVARRLRSHCKNSFLNTLQCSNR